MARKRDWFEDVRYLDTMPVQDAFVLECKIRAGGMAYVVAADESEARDCRAALRRKLNGDTR